MKGLEVIKGDITKLEADAIVNAANSGLNGGGGVDGAIHRGGGPAIVEECKMIRNRQGGCPTGDAVITSGGDLKARYVIHAVGPVWHGGNNREDELLVSAYQNSLRLAMVYNVRTIAFPNISTGVYGFPKERAAALVVREVSRFISGETTAMDRIIFCCFDDENFALYRDLLKVK
ncbi:MAG TPA: O-acetyl-ADP-ribose deacetylase [Ohtaekwangia sp.]|nr:O-acetyl-ADP-ribose deacetylase [Ohtaekwangia sp.]